LETYYRGDAAGLKRILLQEANHRLAEPAGGGHREKRNNKKGCETTAERKANTEA